ncbi:agmatine deiminase family protein [Streptomyces sp. DSM 40907]|uniref:agmatine deiminase family protein n=1 Tax=Streptomyces kutzneri TaxID=3051179 RepID=UPI0028CFDC2D|nr:agmatine deiminase family protein [Streptomyces sp. DSM 40907]
MRDTGPVFRTNGSGGLDAVGLNFNGWGKKQARSRDTLVAGRIASYVGVPFAAAALVGEGGAVEQDGAGTLMATRSSLINKNRNPNKSQAQIESALLAAYGATKVIWFDGVRGQDITDDHVDATSRFPAPGRAAVQMPLASDNDVYAKDARQQYQILSATVSGHERVRDTAIRENPWTARTPPRDTSVSCKPPAHERTGLSWERLNRPKVHRAKARYSSHFVTTDGSWPASDG